MLNFQRMLDHYFCYRHLLFLYIKPYMICGVLFLLGRSLFTVCCLGIMSFFNVAQCCSESVSCGFTFCSGWDGSRWRSDADGSQYYQVLSMVKTQIYNISKNIALRQFVGKTFWWKVRIGTLDMAVSDGRWLCLGLLFCVWRAGIVRQSQVHCNIRFSCGYSWRSRCYPFTFISRPLLCEPKNVCS